VINSMIDKESDALGCRIVIDNKMREFLHKSANGKFGCRLLRSAIHDRAMKVYVDMLEADQTSSLCTIYMEGEDMVRFSAEEKAG
ncbi:MAG: hypothetical protein J5626_02905, partial [Lachnospiraceae bacterium]|nr:hypothetical protein [Lachnospiraceae bacterium]